MLGHPSIAQWGTPLWGTVVLDPAVSVGLDAAGQLLGIDRGVALDSLAQLLAAELTVGADGVGQLTDDAEFGVDVFQGRIPSAAYLDDVNGPLVLVEMRLPAGTRRFATIGLTFSGDVWEGRLVTVGKVLRTTGGGTDDVQLKIDDTNQDGQDRLRDLFLADDPEGSGVTIYVVLLGDLFASRFPIFEGRLARVKGFSRAVAIIDVVRNEAVEDREMGRPVTLTLFPNAPDASLSSTIPLVFGEVEDHEGVAVNVNATSRLERGLDGPLQLGGLVSPFTMQVVTATQPSAAGISGVVSVSTPNAGVLLKDASEFPSSGTVRIDDEELAYTGKVGNELLGITRGVNGTAFAAHTKGSDVEEGGLVAYVFADHALSKLEDIRIEGSDGNLGAPFPDPISVSPLTATVTWDVTPRVRNPDAEPVFQRVHFRDIDPLNRAAGAEFVARESGNYRAFGVAQLSFGQLVLRTNTDGLGIPGDLLRVWLGVVFDPSTLGFPDTAGDGQAGSSSRPFTTQVNGIPGAASALVAGRSYNLQPFDLVPEEIARQDEKTGDRIYDVPDPVFKAKQGRTGERVLSPNVIVDPGLWVLERIAGRVIDGNRDTEAVYFFAGAGEVIITGTADAIFRLDNTPDLGDHIVTSAALKFTAGWGPPFTPLTSPFTVYLLDRTTGERVVTLDAVSFTSAGFPGGLIRDIETFEVAVPPAVIGLTLERLADLDWVVSPKLGVISGLWVGRELELCIQTEQVIPETSATIDPKGSVTNYFEVTDLVGFSPTRNPVADWGFFRDLLRGGRVTYRTNQPPPLDPQLLETFWVVEFVPFLRASTSTPRAFADVRGLTGRRGGDTPADISELVVTQPPPRGMGLPIDRIARETYNPTKASQQADQLRQGFAIRQPTSAVKLLEAIASQGDSRQTWCRGRHQLIRRPRADVSLPVLRTLSDRVDILTKPHLRMGRTDIDDVRTIIAANYRVFAVDGSTSRTVEETDAAAVAKFGQLRDTVTLELVRDDATAQLLSARALERQRRPRWQVEFDVALSGLELRFGDLITVEHIDIPGGSFEVAEVVGLTFDTAGLDRVLVTAVVWKA